MLAHQLIAAKINSANGADASCIEQTLSDADALIGDLLVPPVGDGYLQPGNVSGLADISTVATKALCALHRAITSRYNEGGPSNTCAPVLERELPVARAVSKVL